VLEKKVSSLKAGREEDGRRIAGLEAELGKLQDPVIEQHDMGFELVVNQAALFYGVPTDEGKFDNWKAFYKGELLPLADIPEDDDIGVEGEASGGATEDSPAGEETSVDAMKDTLGEEEENTPEIVNVMD